MEGKRYFWLRLHDDFFRSVRIKRLRKMAGGDTYCIIYLKMQLKAIKTEGVLTWKGYENDFVDELALDLDESPDDVRVTLSYLLSCGLAETEDKVNFFLPYAVENVGSEGASAQRVREFRERKALQCNPDVTPMKQICNGEIEIEKEKDIEIEKEIDKKGVKGGKTQFSPPTREEVKAYCDENGYNIDVDYFFDHYSGNGWKAGRVPMKDWKATVRNWYRRDQKESGAKMKTPYDHLRTETTGDDTDKLARRMGIG